MTASTIRLRLPAPVEIQMTSLGRKAKSDQSGFRQSIGRIIGTVKSHVDEHGEVVSSAIAVVSNTNSARLYSIFLNMTWQTGTSAPSSAGPSFIQNIRYLKVAKIAAFAIAPYALFLAAKEATGLTGEHRVDALLKTVDNLAWASESTAMGVSGLNFAKVVANSVGSIAFTTMVGSSAVSSLATGLLNIKHLIKSSRFLEDLEKKKEACKVVNEVIGLEAHKITTHFNIINAEDLKTQLTTIMEKRRKALLCEDELEKAHTKKLVEETSTLLKGRIKDKCFSNKLAILAAVIMLIGAAILLFTPGGQIAYILMAASSAISLYKAYRERKAVKRLNVSLQEIANRERAPRVFTRREDPQPRVRPGHEMFLSSFAIHLKSD